MTTTIRQYTSALLLAAAIVPFTGRAAEAEEFLLGATVHFTQDKGILDVNLKLARDCNLNAIREDLPWKLAERRRGIVTAPSLFRRIADTARANGLPVLGILAYNNHFYDGGSYPRSAEAVAAYARYAGQVAAGLRGRGVPFYQVWNEWDGGCGMNPAKRGRGDAESYINLLKAAYPALKQADPNATVVSGSVCTGDEYFEKLLQLGMADHCDILSIHTYNFQQRGEAATPEAWQRRMLKLDEMIRKYNNGDSKPVFVTEMGYPSFTGPHGRTAGECAVYLARLMLLARTVPNLRGVMVVRSAGRRLGHHGTGTQFRVVQRRRHAQTDGRRDARPGPPRPKRRISRPARYGRSVGLDTAVPPRRQGNAGDVEHRRPPLRARLGKGPRQHRNL